MTEKKITEKPGETVDTTKVKPTEVERSGARDVPAIDNHPREDQPDPATSNRIDFNDPAKPGHEVVAEQLAAE